MPGYREVYIKGEASDTRSLTLSLSLDLTYKWPKADTPFRIYTVHVRVEGRAEQVYNGDTLRVVPHVLERNALLTVATTMLPPMFTEIR